MAFDLNKILDRKIFSCLRNSLYEVKDDTLQFREAIVRKIYATNFSKTNQMFFDFMPAIRFLYGETEYIAYTTPICEIFLNSYYNDPEQRELTAEDWEFIYCHECLHQIWDTFAVGDKIIKNGIEFNKELLNIASDCVINDYLVYRKKKTQLPFGIFPNVIKEKWDVDYDRNVDTQYSLYLKLLEKREKIQKDMQSDPSLNSNIKDGYPGGQDGGQGGNQGGQGGNQGGQGGNQGGQGGGQGGQGGGQGGQGGGQGGGNKNESKSFVDGWNKALEDYENGKLKL